MCSKQFPYAFNENKTKQNNNNKNPSEIRDRSKVMTELKIEHTQMP